MFGQVAYASELLPRASVFSEKYDHLFWIVQSLCLITFIGTMAVTGYFAVRYLRKSENDSTPRIEGNVAAEVTWSVIPLILVLWAFVVAWGYYVYHRSGETPTTTVHVTGRQWAWAVQYDNGISLVNEIVVPRGKSTRVVLASQDVIHGFYIPAFRTQVAVQPNMFTQTTFIPTKTGVYDLFCTQYCGADHSGMIGKIRVIEPEEFDRWMESGGKSPDLKSAASSAVKTEALSVLGEKLYSTKNCIACHANDGSDRVGPKFNGLFGSNRELNDGKQVTVDENYIRESLMYPQAKMVKGYPAVMPTYKGLLDETEINAITAYIKTLN